MRKNFGAKPILYPLPIFIIASYDVDGISDATNVPHGCESSRDKHIICDIVRE